MNMAWAPGQLGGAALGGAIAGLAGDAVPYLCLTAVCLASLRAPRPAPARAGTRSRMTIRKLLVANRGEIAARVFRTCRELGIATVAVAAPDDRGALHARAADETVEIASLPRTPRSTSAPRSESGADAIHPGYGFLAESADFAEAVERRRARLRRPDAGGAARRRRQARGEADRARGRRAGRAAGRAGGGRLPADRSRPRRAAAGAACASCAIRRELDGGARGRAARGGGGVRRRHASSASATSSGRATSRSSCSATRTAPCVALGERECSVQRRHQKVLEESPSPALDPALRAAMSDAAVAFARAIGYSSAGTAEFMLAGRDFFFLELNGRIQVEHPVTELVTGVDLVARAARGSPQGEPLDAQCRTAARPRGRGAAVRRGSAHVPAAGRARSSGCGCPRGSASTRASSRGRRGRRSPTTR